MTGKNESSRVSEANEREGHQVYICTLPDHAREEPRRVTARSPEDAAECFSEGVFRRWGWECSSDIFPLRVAVDGAVYEVELSTSPVFSASRSV